MKFLKCILVCVWKRILFKRFSVCFSEQCFRSSLASRRFWKCFPWIFLSNSGNREQCFGRTLRPRQNEDTLWRQHCVLRCCPSVAKHGNIAARSTDNRNVSGSFQKNFCVQETKFVSATNVARAWQNESTFGKHARARNVAATRGPFIRRGKIGRGFHKPRLTYRLVYTCDFDAILRTKPAPASPTRGFRRVALRQNTAKSADIGKKDFFT